MKKIIALALVLVMALSMASVAFAAPIDVAVDEGFGDKMVITNLGGEKNAAKRDNKISYDFTSADKGYKGVSLIDKVEISKEGVLSVTFKENLTKEEAVAIKGLITLTSKTAYTLDANNKKVYNTVSYELDGSLANKVEYIEGTKKVADADNIEDLGYMAENTVMVAEEAGYITLDNDVTLTGSVKVEKGEKAQVYFGDYTADAYADTREAIEAYLGEDYEAIVETIVFEGTGFKNAVEFQYDAYAEDPHFFYAWDGEKFVDLEAKYDADEDVDNYVFTADAKGIIIVTDVEIVAAAEETKNPDTGANDVVGVAAALAVVSLVAAGAVSLKK